METFITENNIKLEDNIKNFLIKSMDGLGDILLSDVIL